MFPSFSSPCFHECCSHRCKAVKAQVKMPAHKAPFFSVSKLMSMNYRLIGKSVPIPELLFLIFTPLCSSALSEVQSNKSCSKSTLTSSTDWSPLCSVAMLREETQTGRDTAPHHTHIPGPPPPGVYAHSFTFWLDHASVPTSTVRRGFQWLLPWITATVSWHLHADICSPIVKAARCIRRLKCF